MKLNKKGFTLVELLAVIVVLALLMVVAASSIGTSLSNAKTSAMKTEGEKVVAKTYEDLKMKEVDSSFAYTYIGADGTGNDGDYNFKLTIADGAITAICISDGTDKITSTAVQENKVSWGSKTTGASCSE